MTCITGCRHGSSIFRFPTTKKRTSKRTHSSIDCSASREKMKLLCAIIPLACLPSCQVAAKSSKLQTQSFSSGPSSIDEWVDLGKKQLGLGKAKESAASYRKALKVLFIRWCDTIFAYILRSVSYTARALPPSLINPSLLRTHVFE